MRVPVLLAALLLFGHAATSRAEDAFGPKPAPPESRSFTVGTLRVIALHDAQFVTRNDAKIFGVDVGPSAVGGILKANGLPEDRITLSVNALLVRTGHRIVLLDTGFGPKVQGSLIASLKDAGIAPAEVTDVVITHSHGDHSGGLVDAQGQVAFPKATIRMAASEWSWMQRQPAAADLAKAIAAHVKTFVVGRPIAPGVTPVALDGHTPGHVGYEITSGHDRLMDIGDLAHSSIISLQRPSWTMGFDNDPEVAKATRQATLARLAKERELVFAPHFPFPGIGHVVAEGETFAWSPAAP